MVSLYEIVPLSSGEGLGVRLSEGLVWAHGWIIIRGNHLDVLILCAGEWGRAAAPFSPIFLPSDRHPSLAQQARCEGPIRRKVVTLCIKRIV